MKFYIVTPTFNALSWLQRCIRSVADQVTDGVEVHHHVQDGGSSDGTPEWLANWQREKESVSGYTLTFESGKDAGMYDALNKAWDKIPSDAAITAHLNSDEQYLPGALKDIAEAHLAHPGAEVLACAFVIVDAEGRYICHRRPVQPWRLSSQVVCELNTCSCFHRADAFRQHGIRFDARYRSIADMVMYREMVNYGVRIHICSNLITSVFTVTGNNLAWTAVTEKELQIASEKLPPLLVRARRMMNMLSNIRRRINDWLSRTPVGYSLYVGVSETRTQKEIKHPTAHWGCRSVANEQ